MYRMVLPHLLLIAGLLLSGCQFGLSGLYKDGFPGTATWTVLPVLNFSQKEGVNVDVERMITVLLPSVGVENPQLFHGASTQTHSRVADAARLRSGEDWAHVQGAGLAIGGEVQQWQVNSSGHGEVALSLHVNDGLSGKTLWSISGSSTGLPGENNHEIARRLILDLLQSLPVQKRQ
ncbi:hypothetical protein [Candidatus Sororendozoicomonas aggregata]|uniref:hypothetical protein n=1 Tax=Candidatus Sororendozoicomonas aggregata TaxID=3073239 RepID=UPI002ED52BC1